jgi:hypothetical protein
MALASLQKRILEEEGEQPGTMSCSNSLSVQPCQKDGPNEVMIMMAPMMYFP